jgi:TPR repeat protein
MAAPVGWRIKGVNKTTRQMAEDAAARSGLPVGEWLQRAIDNNVGILPPERENPLVPTELLASARNMGPRSEIGDAEPAENDDPDTAIEHQAPPTIDEDQPQLPLLSDGPRKRGKNVPNVSPMLMAAESRRPSTLIPRVIGVLVLVVLMGGLYWFIDQNTQNKLADENDAVAGRSATPSVGADKTPPAGGENTDPGQGDPEGGRSVVLTPLERLTALANSGNPQAQQDLGLKYAEGNGVLRDPKQAALWLERSASAGMPNAQYHIARMYQKGTGVPSDMNKSYQWYLKAARQGHVRAQYHLGTLYVEGKGTKRDYAEAARWFTRASRAGLADAHYSLGQIHEDGLGVEPDQRRAAGHYRSALAAGSARAATKLTRLEPALKELSVSADPSSLEKDVVPAGPGGAQIPAKDRPLSKSGIKSLQQLLKKLDLEPGPADGVLGNKTKEAIRLYQRFAGLPVDGKPTLELLQDLRQVVGAMSSDAPSGGR